MRKFTFNFEFEKNHVEPSITGTFRDHELVFMGLKKSDTVLIDGYQAFYNYTKKHIDLDRLTLAEASNIKVDGLNK